MYARVSLYASSTNYSSPINFVKINSCNSCNSCSY